MWVTVAASQESPGIWVPFVELGDETDAWEIRATIPFLSEQRAFAYSRVMVSMLAEQAHENLKIQLRAGISPIPRTFVANG